MQCRYCSGKFLRVYSHFGFFSLLILAFSPVTAPDVQSAQLKERRAEVTYSVNLNAPAEAKHVRLWIPHPMSDENQEVSDVVVAGNSSAWGVYKSKSEFRKELDPTRLADLKGPEKELAGKITAGKSTHREKARAAAPRRSP